MVPFFKLRLFLLLVFVGLHATFLDFSGLGQCHVLRLVGGLFFF